MKKIVILCITLGFFLSVNTYAKKRPGVSLQDTSKVITIKGKITDLKSGEPLVFANVYLLDRNVATVSNSDGEFILKVPKEDLNTEVEFSYIGYKNKRIPVSELDEENNEVKLDPSLIPLKQVTIRPADPYNLILGALKNVPKNYSTEPVMLIGFYREAIQQGRRYVAISEAIVDIFKAPYDAEFRKDLARIYKGRKNQDVAKMDTIIFKLQGGPATTLLLDVVKNPYLLLDREMLQFYEYDLAGTVSIDDKPNYVIEFKQKQGVDDPLYYGKIFLEMEDLAITRLEFKLNMENPEKAADMFVMKKPSSLEVIPKFANYLVDYRNIDGKWYFNYARGEAQFVCDWKKKLFNSTYTAMMEIATTDVDKENVEKFKFKEAAKSNEIFMDKLSYFEDEDFWGDYNFIKPDESIETAIKRLNRKLKRRL